MTHREYPQKQKTLKATEKKKRRYWNRRNLAFDILGRSCVNCGCDDTEKLVFHHKDKKTKLFSVSRGERKNLNLFIKEVNKCVVLCVSCHQKLHRKLDNPFFMEDITEEELNELIPPIGGKYGR